MLPVTLQGTPICPAEVHPEGRPTLRLLLLHAAIQIGFAHPEAAREAHFWLMRIPPADLARRLRNRVAHVHVSDCDGIHHGDMPPGRGNTPSKEYLAAIRDTGFIGADSIELEFPRDPREMAAWVEEAHGAALQLLKDADVHTA
jgi:D-psicose/D-tagatose/L-ribulose 3-epimerase